METVISAIWLTSLIYGRLSDYLWIKINLLDDILKTWGTELRIYATCKTSVLAKICLLVGVLKFRTHFFKFYLKDIDKRQEVTRDQVFAAYP